MHPPTSNASGSACPRCGRSLPPAAPLGACPHCLLAAGFVTQPAAPSDTPPPTPAELAPEFPRLEILELLGRGGMGAVYKARQRDLDRHVALKILRPGLDADPSFAERFAREARALAQLNHPGIVILHEFGRTAAGRYFILMEFVDGVNLRQLLAAGRLAPREALAIVPPLCDALQYAHDHGLVHRDIKPENILIDRLGRVKIADFGLAKLAASADPANPAAGESFASGSSNTADPGATGLTEAGGVMGTPRYMAPEQRERPAEVDHRSDIYALGVVLYQMLTGELPDEKQLQPPSHRVHIDVRLDAIVLRALEKNPALRYAAAGELKTRIETLGVAGNPSLPAPPAPAPTPPARHPRRRFPVLRLTLFVLYALYLGWLAATARFLPVRTASHFNAAGLPDGWMSPADYLVGAALLPAGMIASLLGVAALLRRLPARLLNLPDREHWLSPENRSATVALLGRWFTGLACLLVLFFAELHALVVLANRSPEPRLVPAASTALIIAVLSATMLWLVGFILRFAAPAAPAARLRRQNLILAILAVLAVVAPAALLIDEWHDLPAKIRRQHAELTPASATAFPPPLAPDFAVRLPGGGYIELMGIALQPSDQAGWWAPDGTPLAHVDWSARYSAAWPVTFDNGTVHADGRQFVFHTEGPGEVPSVLEFGFFDPEGRPSAFTASLDVRPATFPLSDANLATARLMATRSPAFPNNTRWPGALLPVRPGQTATRIRLLVADGPLQRHTHAFDGPARSIDTRIDGKTIILGPVFERGDGSAVAVTAEIGGKTEWRLRALDAEGLWHIANLAEARSTGTLQHCTLAFDGLRPADVVELALWTRPARWIEFDDVSLVRGKITAPVAKIASAIASADAAEIQTEVRFIRLARDQYFHPDQISAAELATLPGSEVLSAPRVTVRSGAECEITVAEKTTEDSPADQRFQSTPVGVSVRLRPILKDGEVSFDALFTITTREAAASSLVTTTERKVQRVCPLDAPLALDLGLDAHGRRQIAVLRFSLPANPPPTSIPATASASVPPSTSAVQTRLLELTLELAGARVRYGQTHPILIALETEFAALDKQTPAWRDARLREQATEKRQLLVGEREHLSMRYLASHPAMIENHQKLAALDALLAPAP